MNKVRDRISEEELRSQSIPQNDYVNLEKDVSETRGYFWNVIIYNWLLFRLNCEFPWSNDF